MPDGYYGAACMSCGRRGEHAYSCRHALAERERVRMAAESIPVGSDDPALVALGAPSLGRTPAQEARTPEDLEFEWQVRGAVASAIGAIIQANDGIPLSPFIHVGSKVFEHLLAAGIIALPSSTSAL